MNIESIIEFIARYGWSSVFIAASLAIIYLTVRYASYKMTKSMSTDIKDLSKEFADRLSEQNNTIIHEIHEQNDKLITYITNKDNNNVETHSHMLEERMKCSEEINQKLKEIALETGSIHTFILEFHNSYQNLSGTPFAKYSCTYEYAGRDIPRYANVVCGYPFSIISGIVKDILKSKDKQMTYSDKEEIISMPMMFDKYMKEHIEGLIFNAMYDNHNNMIGLLVMEFYDDIDEDDINYEELKLVTAQITSILNLRYKYIDTNKQQNK